MDLRLSTSTLALVALAATNAHAQSDLCRGLTGVARGLCTAGVAAGCADGTGSAAACGSLASQYQASTGAPAPWLSTATHVFLGFYEYLDLESGAICEDDGLTYCGRPPYDFWFAFNGGRANPAVLFQVQWCGDHPAEIAFLEGVPFASVTSASIAGAAFTPALVDFPLDPGDTVILHTCDGGYFKIGNAACFAETGTYTACADPSTSPTGDWGVAIDHARL